MDMSRGVVNGRRGGKDAVEGEEVGLEDEVVLEEEEVGLEEEVDLEEGVVVDM